MTKTKKKRNGSNKAHSSSPQPANDVLSPEFVRAIQEETNVHYISTKALEAILAKMADPELPPEHAAVLRTRFINTVEGELWQINAWMLRCFVALDRLRSVAMAKFALDLLNRSQEVVSQISREVESVFPNDAEVIACFFPPPLAHWLSSFNSFPAPTGPITESVAEVRTHWSISGWYSSRLSRSRGTQYSEAGAP